MKITRENYETFCIDYLDGTLPEALVAELRIFLALNPDLAEEFAGIAETAPLTAPPITFKEKVKLEAAFDEDILIACAEGDLEPRVSHQTEIEIMQSVQAADFLKYRKARLVADSSVVYPYKEDLIRKKSTRVIALYTAISSAAAILLLALLMAPQEDYTHRANTFSFNEPFADPASVLNVGTVLTEQAGPVDRRVKANPEVIPEAPVQQEFTISYVTAGRPAPSYFTVTLPAQEPIAVMPAVAEPVQEQIAFIPDPKYPTPGELLRNKAGKVMGESEKEPRQFKVMSAVLLAYEQVTGKDAQLETIVTDGQVSSVSLVAGRFQFTRKK